MSRESKRKLKSRVNSFLLRWGKVAAARSRRFIILNKSDPRQQIKFSLRFARRRLLFAVKEGERKGGRKDTLWEPYARERNDWWKTDDRGHNHCISKERQWTNYDQRHLSLLNGTCAIFLPLLPVTNTPEVSRRETSTKISCAKDASLFNIVATIVVQGVPNKLAICIAI